MTPAEKLGYKVGDEFEVVGGDAFNIGCMVKLFKDDASHCPPFEGIDCEASDGEAWSYCWLENVKPLSRITLQPGDYVSTKGMTEDECHAVARAFMAARACNLKGWTPTACRNLQSVINER